MTLLRKAHKLLSLAPYEWGDLVRAQLAILEASWRLRRVRIGDLIRGSGVDPSHSGLTSLTEPAGASGSGVPHHAARLATALQRAAENGPLRPECLVRSLALHNLLIRRGISGSVIRVGVRNDSGGFLAHAWVELNGVIVGDEPSHVRRFTRLERLDIRRAG
jgi:hypothetical protein